MPTLVRPIRDDELPAFIDAVSTGFLDRPDVARVAAEVGKPWDLRRTYGTFDDGRIVGTFRSWAGRLTIPGCSELNVASVPGVTVAPAHRGRRVVARSE